MKKFKIITCLIVVLVMIFSLTACTEKAGKEEGQKTEAKATKAKETEAKQEEEGPYVHSLPLCEEETVLTIFVRLVDSARQHFTTSAENVVMQEMARQTNVTLEFIHPPAGDNGEFANIIIASGDYPDIFRQGFEKYPGGIDGAIDDEILINMNDLIEKYCPSFFEMVKENGQEKNIVSDRGTIIKLGAKFTPPFLADNTTVGLITRADWLEKYGLEVPTNLEELKNVLVTFKENGVEIPFALPKYNFWMVKNCNIPSSIFGVSHKQFQVNDGKVAYGPALAEYKEYLEFYKWMYDNELVDLDFASHNGQDSLKLFQNGTAGVYPAGIWELRQIKSLGPEMDPEFKIAGIPWFEKDGGTNTLQPIQTHFKGYPWYISTTCEDPVLAMKYIEYLYQPETRRLTAWGLGNDEYPTYEIVDGMPKFTGFMQNKENPGEYDFPTCRDLYTAGDFQIENDDAMERQQYDDETVLAIFDAWSKNSTNESRYSDFITPTVDESKEITKRLTDIETYSEEMFHKFVMGSESLDKFDEYIKTIEDMGLNEMLEYKQAAYDRFMER